MSFSISHYKERVIKVKRVNDVPAIVSTPPWVIQAYQLHDCSVGVIWLDHIVELYHHSYKLFYNFPTAGFRFCYQHSIPMIIIPDVDTWDTESVISHFSQFDWFQSDDVAAITKERIDGHVLLLLTRDDLRRVFSLASTVYVTEAIDRLKGSSWIPLVMKLLYKIFKTKYPIEQENLCLTPTLRLTKSEAIRRIGRQIEHHSSVYLNLSKKEENIDYNDHLARIAYLYAYVPVHVRLVQYALEAWKSKNGDEVNKMFRTAKKVCCLGGGPGGDVLGLLRYLHYSYTDKPRLFVSIYDRADAWSETWSDVWFELTATYNPTVSPIYAQLDLGDSATGKRLRERMSFADYDIYTLIKFWSSICCSDISPMNLKYIISQAKIGAHILYIDNGYGTFTVDFIARIVCDKWHLVFSEDSPGHHLFKDEQKTDLFEYLPFFGDRAPLFKPNIHIHKH
ncbi:hypothetical protein BC936DRAFT_144475, partial [Jimgerdemannia flammicorona]